MEVERKYGVETKILFPLITAGDTDYLTGASHASGDTSISKDEGAFANTSNGFVEEGNGWYSITLTATEMEAARIVVTIIDQGTKAWEDQSLVLATYGNASAQHAVDRDDSVRAGMTALPNAAADAAGGLPISDAGGLDMDAIYTAAEASSKRMAGGTAQSGTASTIVLASASSFADNALNGQIVRIIDGAGVGQARIITTNTNADDTCNVYPNWTTNPDNTSVYEISDGAVDVTHISGDPTAADALELQYDGTGITGDSYPATQAQVGNIASGTAAINTTAESTEATTPAVVGTPTNTYTSTVELDGTYHSWVPAAGELEFAYNFDIGADGVPVSINWHGYAQTNNDLVTVYARNWAGSSWQQIGTIDGTVGTTDKTETFDLTTAHVGTGSNVGKVRIRFVSTGGSIITAFATDRILCSFAQASTGIVNGSTVTLAEATLNSNFVGNNWVLDLGGQEVTGSYFKGATVTGVSSSATGGVTFEDCSFGAATIPPGTYVRCGFGDGDGLVQGSDDGEYVFIDCFSIVAGAGTPDFQFTGLGGSSGINNRGWRGGFSVTLDSACTLSHEVLVGGGTTIVTGGADCEIRGTCRELDITMSAAETVQFVGVTGPIALSGTTTATVNLHGVSASLTDTTSGATVTDNTVTGPDVQAILVDTAAIDSACTETRLSQLDDAPGKVVAEVDVLAYARCTEARMQALTDWIDGGRLDLIQDAILADTAEIGTAGAGLTDLGGMSTAMKAEVQAEANDALVAQNLDHFAGANAPDAPTSGSWLGDLIEDDGGTWRFNTNALENAPTGGVARYEHRGDATQMASGEVRWCSWVEKDGQPADATNCTVKIVHCDGDGTITDYAGATETVDADDENNVFNGEIADPGFSVGEQDYIYAVATVDTGSRVGIIPIKAPARIP